MGLFLFKQEFFLSKIDTANPEEELWIILGEDDLLHGWLS